MSTRCFYSANDTLAIIHLWATLMETAQPLPKYQTRNLGWYPKFNSYNCNMSFVKIQRTQSLTRSTTHAAISTFSTSHNSISSQYSQPFTSLAALKANPIFHAANKKLFIKIYFDLRHLILLLHPSFNHHHHHHHVALVARISLTLSRHSSLSFIALGRSSGQHPVSSHSCWMYVRAGRPTFARPCVGVHKSTSLMSSSLLLQQCPACLVRLTWIVFVIGGRWPYSWCLVGCCRQDLFKIARSILV